MMQGQEPAARTTTPGDRATLFYAVLEGLYDEGVGNDDIDILLREDPATKAPMHFVGGCPLCNPAIDALRLYRGRPRFHGLKSDSDTFGPGLSAPEREALRNADIVVRLRVLHDLVERSLQRKLSSMRLTKDERTAWHQALVEMREKGGALFGQACERGAAGGLGAAKGCAVCDGMRDAGTWTTR
jgi:hypothetical protein